MDSGAIGLVGLGAAVAGVGILRGVQDPDTFWHIKAGQQLLESGGFVGPDPLSLFSSRPWVLHEWAPEVLYASLYRLTGYAGVAWLEAVTAAALLLVAFVVCRQFARPVVAASVAAVAWLGASGSLAARPQMVTFLFVLILSGVWLRTIADGRPRWWLVPFTWLWACCHGLWIAAIVTGVAVTAGLALDRSLARRRLLQVGAVPVVSLAAAALTPVGPRLLLAPFEVNGYAGFVSEWRPAGLIDHYFLATATLAATCLLVWSRRGEASWAHISLCGVGVVWALLYTRTVPLGALTLAPLTASALALRSQGSIARTRIRGERTVLVIVAIAVLVGPLILAPTRGARPGPAIPTGLDSAIAALPQGTVMWNRYELGGWLLLEHPNVSVVIDPRTEVYDIPYVERYMTTLDAREGWHQAVIESGASSALLHADGALTSALRREMGWRVVGQDAGYALLSE